MDLVLNRDPVCAADDVINNEIVISVPNGLKLSEIMIAVAKGCGCPSEVWIFSSKMVLGVLYSGVDISRTKHNFRFKAELLQISSESLLWLPVMMDSFNVPDQVIMKRDSKFRVFASYIPKVGMLDTVSVVSSLKLELE